MLVDVQLEQHDAVLVATISGDVDMSNAGDVGAALTGALSNDASRLILDLTGVDYFDSAGIHLVYRLREQLRTRGQSLRMVVPAASPVRDALELAAVDQAITVDASLDAALAAPADA